jgi:hypothetical protein
MRRAAITALLLLATGSVARAQLPTGYLVWTRGNAGDAASRKIYRLTLPGKTEVQALTAGEDIQPRISPDGQWVAYAKAKLSGGSDYHAFNLWKPYVVSIHGVGDGRKELKIDDDGYWPSWGGKNVLYYNQVDGTQTKIVRVTLNEYGKVTDKQVFFSTAGAFPGVDEINECFVSPDATWFAARTRGTESVTGVGAYQVKPPSNQFQLLARAGSVGCMPLVAPDSKWGIIAGAEEGIRWGEAPTIAGRKTDQLLIPARPNGGKAYHPGFSSDGLWVLAAHGTDQDHNSGAYDVYAYAIDPTTRAASGEQALATGGLNGWPSIWVGTPGPPPPPRPYVEDFYPSSYTLVRGEQVTLTWVTGFADQVELDGAAVQPEGSQVLQPTATTRYALVAKSSKVSDVARAEVEVTVNETAQPVSIASFTAGAESIAQGSSTTLSWTVKNPTTLDVNGTRVAPTGTLEVSPSADATYLLTARGSGGPVTRSLTITVKPIGPTELPDRGGFVCSAARGEGAPALIVVGLALLALRLARRRER